MISNNPIIAHVTGNKSTIFNIQGHFRIWINIFLKLCKYQTQGSMNKLRLNQDGPNVSTDQLDFISTKPVRTYLTYDSGSRKKGLQDVQRSYVLVQTFKGDPKWLHHCYLNSLLTLVINTFLINSLIFNGR